MNAGAGRLLTGLSAVLLAVLTSSACVLTIPGTGSPTGGAPLTVGPAQDVAHEVEGELVTASTLTADGRGVVVGTSAGRVHVLAMGEVTARRPPLVELAGRIDNIVISPDGRQIVIRSHEGDLAFGPVGGELFVVDVEAFGATAFDPTGFRIAVTGPGAMVIDTGTGRIVRVHEPAAGTDGGYGAVAVTQLGDVVALRDGGTDTWADGSPTAVQRPLDCGCAVSSATISPDGAWVGFGTADGHLIVMDTVTGRVLADETVSTAPNDRVRAVAAADDGGLLIGVSQTGRGLVWDTRMHGVGWRGAFPGRSPMYARFVESDRAVLFSEQVAVGGYTGSGFRIVSSLVRLSS